MASPPVADMASTNFSAPYFDTALETVSIAKVKSIGNQAFSKRPALTTVNLPAATYIGLNTFCECDALTTVNLPKAAVIDELAFAQCTSLSSISMPAATKIKRDAFMGCSKLSKLQLGATPPAVVGTPFADCPSPRTLELVDSNGKPLKGNAFKSAQTNYLEVDDGDSTDELWHGWSIKKPLCTIAASASPADGGTVSGAGSYETGSTVTLTAKPNSGYKFVRWVQGGIEVSTSNPYTFTCTDDCSLTATFEEDGSADGGSTGLFDIRRENLTIYPNPTQGAVQVEATGMVMVYNANGQLLQHVPS